MIVDIIKESMGNEDLCENSSVIVKNINNSLTVIGDLKTLFLMTGGFSFVLILLNRYSKNKVICKNLTSMLSVFFLVILGSETDKEFSTFVGNIGIETINKVLNEQICERETVLNCTSIFRIFSRLVGNPQKLIFYNDFLFVVL